MATDSSRIYLADARSGFCIHELRGHQSAVSSVAWSPKTEYILASGGMDGKILLWDTRSSRGVLKSLNQHALDKKSVLPSAHDYPVTSLKFTSDGLSLVSQGSDCNINLWNADTFENIIVNYPVKNRPRYTPGISGAPYRNFEVCCDTSRPLLFVPNGKDLQVFDLYNGTQHETILGNFQRIYCLGYRTSAQELYSGGLDLNLTAWSSDGSKALEREYLPGVDERGYRAHYLFQTFIGSHLILSDIDDSD